MLKLRLQFFGHLMWRADSLEKTLMLGKIEGRRRRGWQRKRWLDGITTQWTWFWASSWSWWWTGKPGVLQSMGLQRVGHKWATELNWYRFLNYSLNTSRSFLSQSFALASPAWNSLPSGPCPVWYHFIQVSLQWPPLSTVSKSPTDTLFLSLSISVPSGLFWFCFVSWPVLWPDTILYISPSKM